MKSCKDRMLTAHGAQMIIEHKTGTGFRLLGEGDARQLVEPKEFVSAMEEALKVFSAGTAVHPLRMGLACGGNGGYFGVMPAYVPAARSLGAKLITVFDGNHRLNLPSHFGIVVLLDHESGAPKALIDGNYVTEARTAAVSMVAARHLCHQPIRRAAIIGCGVQARGHLRALAAELATLDEIAVWGIEGLEEFVRTMSATVPVELRQARDAEDAARTAELVILVTSSDEPVIRQEWICPGTLVISVGACRPERREIDPRMLRQARLIVDSREAALAESGDIMRGIADGWFGLGHIAAELGDVISGREPGRTRPDEIVVFKSLGLAIEDLYAAELIYSRALERGVGKTLALTEAV
jgi:alanine dehydrogenase